MKDFYKVIDKFKKKKVLSQFKVLSVVYPINTNSITPILLRDSEVILCVINFLWSFCDHPVSCGHSMVIRK